MYSGRSFRDAYLEIYKNLNEAASTNPYTNPKAAETAVKKATEAPKATPAPETPKATPAPEAPKSPFASKSELENLRSSAARATVAGPSKEAQALMSPRTKRILSGNSVYSRGSGRDDMIAGNLQRARGGSSTQASTSTDKSSGPDMSRFKKLGPAPSSSSSSSQSPSTSSSSSSTSPTTSSGTRVRTGNINVAIGNEGDRIGNNRKVVNKTVIKKSPEDRLPKRPDGKSEKPDGSNDNGDTREKLKGLRKLRAAYNAQQLASSYEYENDTLIESHYEVGDKVTCKASGMTGKVVKVDPEEKGKYYTVKREDGKSMKYAPDELKKVSLKEEIVVKLKSPEERAKYQANLEKRKKRKEEPSFWDNLRKRREEGLPSQIDIKRVVAAQNKKEQEKRFKKQSEEKERRERAAALKKEQVDLYDIILSHLLDEGYAETQEAAEVIMVNMSEEWRQSIVKSCVD
jgi:hypothetical protein